MATLLAITLCQQIRDFHSLGEKLSTCHHLLPAKPLSCHHFFSVAGASTRFEKKKKKIDGE
jgi:hypothetical protein